MIEVVHISRLSPNRYVGTITYECDVVITRRGFNYIEELERLVKELCKRELSWLAGIDEIKELIENNDEVRER